MTLDSKNMLKTVRDVYESILQTSSVMNVSFRNLKSINLTRTFNLYGNKHYANREYDQAILLFTKSLASCWPNIDELALVYTNRAAVLFDLGDYASCLLDINRALHCKFIDPSLKNKIYQQKETCLAKMKECGKYSDILVDEIDPPIRGSADGARSWYSRFNLNNPTLSNVSRKIQLKYNGPLGRHLEAVEDIKPGEILSVQELFLFHVLAPRSRYLKHCSFCLKRCKALIPCETCPMALYCSNKCRTQAFVSYHELECRLYFYYPERMIAMKLDDKLAMQALLIGTEKGVKLENLMETLPIEDILGCAKASSVMDDPSYRLSHFKNDYISLLTLSSTFNLTYMNRCVEKAVETVLMLKKVSYFEKVGKKYLHKVSSRSFGAELYAVALLLNHYNVLKTRTIGFIDSRQENAEWGGGFTLLNSLVNHSCHPNTAYFWKERCHTLFSVRPIKKGEHVLVSFNAKFENESKFERQLVIRQFGYVPCKCEACVNNWPTIDNGLLTHRTEIRMPKMPKKFCTPEIYRIGDGKKQCEPEVIIRTVARLLEELYRITKPPSLPIVLAENLLAEVMKMLFEDIPGGKARNKKLRTMFDKIILKLRMHHDHVDRAVMHATEKIQAMSQCIFIEFSTWDKFSK